MTKADYEELRKKGWLSPHGKETVRLTLEMLIKYADRYVIFHKTRTGDFSPPTEEEIILNEMIDESRELLKKST